MNTLNENELHAISGGDAPMPTASWEPPTTGIDPAVWQQLQDYFAAQQAAANQALIRALTGGMAD